MGFDISIDLKMMMCENTGKPYHYKYIQEEKKTERVYGLPDINVPEELRKYLVGRGHIYHAYTTEFNQRDIYNIDVQSFLDEFPSWKDVKESGYYVKDDGWSSKDHKQFKKLLKWCVKQEAFFYISWSY